MPRAGQRKPAPLLLHYEAGGYNCLHRDLYGEVAFPFQLAAFLSRAGGATTPGAGSSWWSSARGWSRAGVRHGVSRVRSGRRYPRGVIFHDAR